MTDTEIDGLAPNQFQRIRDEITDSFDEELELEMEDDRLEELLKDFDASGFQTVRIACN